MIKRYLGIAVAAGVVLAAAYAGVRWFSAPHVNGVPVAAQGARAVPVTVTAAVRKKTPVVVEALGTVTPMASVAIKSRLDSEIVSVHFADGARVNEGDVLITLDSRALEAQIQAAQGMVARDQAQLEGAERDVRRYTELVAKNATPITSLENAKTQAAMYTAAKAANEAQLRNLRVQLSYATIRAPISGRISAATVKVGNFVRSADLQPIATIIQTAPIYVTFSVPQAVLPDIRKALAAETATIQAIVPGEERAASGVVAMIENTVDSGTGMVAVRASMPNSDELLWPGTLVTVQVTLREDDAVTVPSAAVQVSQTGTFVFVVKDGKASVRPVKVARVVGQESVLESGVEVGETVVTDGFLLLTDGARVAVRGPQAGS
ncbi:MAG TPA: efflux RND transporter periplasmic adaptor subunit [Xanthobacteraceae bacterium]|nr:efflux RND transporter periplasmic adaptor subunit [Xanthobacteraceae bacterium]